MSLSALMTTVDAVKNNKSNVTKVSYRQVTPDRSVSGTNFANGEIIYRFTVSGNSWWIPSKSFVSLRSKIYSTGTTQPTVATDQAPAPGFTACLFSQAEVRLDDRPLSRINAFLPQIDALKTRLTKSKAWRDSVGKSANFWDPNFDKRRASIVSNEVIDEDEVVEQRIKLSGTSITVAANGTISASTGTALSAETAIGDIIVVSGIRMTVTTAATNAAGATMVLSPTTVALPATANFYMVKPRLPTTGIRRHNLVETVWQPPLSIFDINTPLPPGNYSLHLTPNTSNYKNASIESVSAALTTQDVVVDHMYFNACVAESENIPDSFKYYLDLSEIAVQPKQLSASAGEQVLDFSVPPTTYALTVASQQASAGSSTLYVPTKFKLQDDEDLTLTQLRVSYAGQVQPSPDLQVSYTTATDHLAKLYVTNLMNANGYDSDVLESKKEWQDMGIFSHYTFLKPADDSSTRVDVAITLNTPTSANCLLFSHFSSVAEITYQSGRTTSVRLDYA